MLRMLLTVLLSLLIVPDSTARGGRPKRDVKAYSELTVEQQKCIDEMPAVAIKLGESVSDLGLEKNLKSLGFMFGQESDDSCLVVIGIEIADMKDYYTGFEAVKFVLEAGGAELSGCVVSAMLVGEDVLLYHRAVMLVRNKEAAGPWSLMIEPESINKEELRGTHFAMLTGALGQFEPFEKELKLRDKKRRMAAVKALEILGNPKAVPLLKKRSRKERNRKVKKQVKEVLKSFN